ncbi:MAG TPA: hypothetical protein VMA74_13670 [Dyella sp.]|uniref:hypothetical protein n=1 Tax=Dyella sp. TaxID=1869338 RepID=UPI002C0B0200|nr:hypothetical protein [Dyella sp.]HUB90767.1 hypothetical protein [Dyella sp.]
MAALRSRALVVPTTALRALAAQLFRVAAVVTAIPVHLGDLALARSIRTFVIDLHADITSLHNVHIVLERAPCDAAGLAEVKIRASLHARDTALRVGGVA